MRATRGPVRDAATLIDESGMLLAASEEACEALLRLDWPWLFDTQRMRCGRDWMPFAFGHTLIEKLLAPYKGLTAVVVCLPLTEATLPRMDRAVSEWVQHTALAPPLLPHLQMLGIPGWWAANQDPAFYADAAVFRQRRGRARGAGAAPAAWSRASDRGERR